MLTFPFGFFGSEIAGLSGDAVHFDGTNDYLKNNTALPGIADTKTFIASFWLNPDVDGGYRYIFDFAPPSSNQQFAMHLNPDDTVRFFARNAAGTIILLTKGDTDTIKAADGWVHVLIAVDLATSTIQMYQNDVAVTMATTTVTNDTISLTGATIDTGVGSTMVIEGTSLFSGDMYEVYLNTDEYLDISVVANRRKFITAGGSPVYLGDTGELPTGSQPLMYFQKDYTSFGQNRGYGGDLTIVGALTAATAPT